MENYLKEYQKWCESDEFDEETKKELLEIKDNPKEIEDRFYKELEFGTAGLRGIIGAGTNRMNKYIVGKATQGLANYIIKQGTQAKGVAISYDSRKMSPEFSKYSALVLNANGIKTYLFDHLRPVPELSFAVRNLGCTAGIMITASHNKPQYNGYKVYWDDGAQIIPPVDKGIMDEVKAIISYNQIKEISEEEAIKKGLYNIIGKEIDNKYIDALKKCVLNSEIIHQFGKDLKIVYTPLHGAGREMSQRILDEIGFEKVYTVPEQEEPDERFPTVEYPNPEAKEAFKMALDLAKEKDADLVLATDPDADRLGIYAKDNKSGKYMEFTGNMSGLLIAEYRLSVMKEKGILPKNGMLVSTIVSSNLAKAIAKEYGIEFREVLTGFKYIGEQIKIEEQKENGKKYLFGFEESYGCLIEDYARDKDGISAVMSLCEAAAFYKSKGITLWNQMLNIYEKYGYYKEGQVSITLEGASGAQKITEMMNSLRNNLPTEIGKYKVLEFKDIENNIVKDITTNKTSETGLPKSNVLYFALENDAWCCVRPSGTEPKIKLYFGVKSDSLEEAEEDLEELKMSMTKKIK